MRVARDAGGLVYAYRNPASGGDGSPVSPHVMIDQALHFIEVVLASQNLWPHQPPLPALTPAPGNPNPVVPAPEFAPPVQTVPASWSMGVTVTPEPPVEPMAVPGVPTPPEAPAMPTPPVPTPPAAEVPTPPVAADWAAWARPNTPEPASAASVPAAPAVPAGPAAASEPTPPAAPRGPPGPAAIASVPTVPAAGAPMVPTAADVSGVPVVENETATDPRREAFL